MAVFVFPVDRVSFRAIVSGGIVLRVAAGLFAHGLMRPFAPAIIEARSGRVRPR